MLRLSKPLDPLTEFRREHPEYPEPIRELYRPEPKPIPQGSPYTTPYNFDRPPVPYAIPPGEHGQFHQHPFHENYDDDFEVGVVV